MDLTISQYRSFILTLTFQTALGNPFSLAGYVVGLMAKETIPTSDSTAIYTSESPVGNPAFGVLSFLITPAVTGTLPIGAWVYDVSIKDPTGAYISTVLSGAFNVVASCRQSF